MNKIKVLHLIKSLGRGGAEMLLQETLKEHNKDKFEFHYIYFLPWKNQMVAGIQAAGGIVSNFPASNNIGIALRTRKIIKYIRLHNIRILHCHLPWSGFVGRFIHMWMKIPVVYSEHNKQERYHWITKFINKITFNRQTKVIAVSHDVEESIEKFINPRIPVQTIRNGVNINHFVRNKNAGLSIRESHGIDPGCILLGTIAVFRFQKRLKEWIEVFKMAHQKFPRIRGCIVGDGILKDEIKIYLKEQGMEEFILFPGMQTNVRPWLSAIDIFMMTSKFEGLPLAVLEAMSMECAVISTDAGGIKEVIRNNENGFMVPQTEWHSLIDSITFFLENPEEIKKFGRRARQTVQESFSINSMILQTEELYRSLINPQ